MHKSYEMIRNHSADFRINYSLRDLFNSAQEPIEVYQGTRYDVSFHEDPFDQIYMIWPEFEDSENQIIIDCNISISKTGTARMWIVNNEMRIKHIKNLYLGCHLYLREGSTIIADCEVIEILGLNSNPKK